MQKIVFLHHCYIALRSRSMVGVKVKGLVRVKVRVQGHGSNVLCAAVDIRGSALPSAAKSINHHYHSKVIVCVSVHCLRSPKSEIDIHYPKVVVGNVIEFLYQQNGCVRVRENVFRKILITFSYHLSF